MNTLNCEHCLFSAFDVWVGCRNNVEVSYFLLLSPTLKTFDFTGILRIYQPLQLPLQQLLQQQSYQPSGCFLLVWHLSYCALLCFPLSNSNKNTFYTQMVRAILCYIMHIRVFSWFVHRGQNVGNRKLLCFVNIYTRLTYIIH